MKALRIILIILVVIVGGYSIWMATIDPAYKVERTEIIEAEPSDVYATVSDFTTWKDWSKWHKMDPEMEVTFGDKSAGEGASYTWKGEKSGAGTQTITAAVPNESMETHIAFEGMGESDGYWKFEEVEDGKTKVTWGFTGEMPFFYRVFALGMDESVGNDFEEGLSNLKEKIESMPKAEKPSVDMEVVDVKAMPYFGIRHDIAWSEMSSEFFGNNYGAIMGYLGENAGESMLMPPMAIYYEWDEENKRTVIELAIASKSDKKGNDQIKKGMTYEGKALKAVHMGSYEATGAVHEAMNAHIKEKGYGWPEGAGVWEVYVTDPMEEPDTAKWITEIYYPIIPEGNADAGEDGGEG